MVRSIEMRARIAACGLVLFLVPRSVAQTIYWTDIGTSKIQRVNLKGGVGVEDLVTVGQVFTPVSIALDVPGGKMYWTEASPADFMIGRANLDGTDVVYLVTGLVSPSGIALDTSGGKMYWTDIGTGKIQRANLDGSAVEDLLTFGVVFTPVDIALDVDAGKMYWTEAYLADFMISRADLDGSNVELLVTGLVNPSGIALDTSGGKMYWTDLGTGKIQRANLDGSVVEDLVTTGVIAPVRLALDLAGGKMYWTERSPADFMISRANLDGSEVEFLITGLTSPSGIALAGEELGQAILPVDQARSVHSFVSVPQCGGDAFDNDQAEAFESFDSTVEATLDCALALGLATASQQSEIVGASMSASGISFSAATAGVPDTMHAIAVSVFEVTFELPSTSVFGLTGMISLDTPDFPIDGLFAQIRLSTPGGGPIVDHTLSTGAAGKHLIEFVEETGVLAAGLYTLRANASTGIDNEIPPSLVGRAAYQMLFQVATGDGDGDADVDIFDFTEFTTCSDGPGAVSTTECGLFDFDFDGDVDWVDFGTFQLLYTGPR